MKRLTLAALIFASITLALTAVSIYTGYYYYQVYRATHVLNIQVNKFSITMLNSTYATTQTGIQLINPSNLSFDVIYVTERLTYDQLGQEGQYITGTTQWFQKPRQLRPASNLTVTINEMVPAYRIENSRTVFAEIYVFFKGPLVGEFLLSSGEVLNENNGAS